MPLNFAYITHEDLAASKIPARKVNGGLFTGESFPIGAQWGHVPCEPNTHALMEKLSLESTETPKEVYAHLPTNFRPGNNEPIFANHTNINGFWCIA